ncbi:hypothetical protein FRC15_002611 [Serendipita sp. 397]|nr:hypothetical protein FRC15_002611 [Serendipita sp. 397]
MSFWDTVIVDAAHVEQAGQHRPWPLTLRKTIYCLLVLLIVFFGASLGADKALNAPEQLTTVNLASFENGARFIPYFTKPPPMNLLWLTPILSPTYHPAEIILRETSDFSRCWKIPTRGGSLGVRLSHMGVIHTVKIEYNASGIGVDQDAGKIVQLWAINTTRAIQQAMSSHHDRHTLSGLIMYNGTLSQHNITVSMPAPTCEIVLQVLGDRSSVCIYGLRIGKPHTRYVD